MARQCKAMLYWQCKAILSIVLIVYIVLCLIAYTWLILNIGTYIHTSIACTEYIQYALNTYSMYWICNTWQNDSMHIETFMLGWCSICVYHRYQTTKSLSMWSTRIKGSSKTKFVHCFLDQTLKMSRSSKRQCLINQDKISRAMGTYQRM